MTRQFVSLHVECHAVKGGATNIRRGQKVGGFRLHSERYALGAAMGQCFIGSIGLPDSA